MKLTQKQIQILTTLEVGESPLLDLDQLVEAVPYETTKQSMQFSVRALVGKGLIEKAGRDTRRGKSRRLLSLTKFGKEMLGSA